MSPLTMADIPLQYRQTEDAETLRQAIALVPLVEQEARLRLVEWLRDRIESAGSPAELGAAWRQVLRYGHSVPRDRLARVARIRGRALAAEARRVRAGKGAAR